MSRRAGLLSALLAAAAVAGCAKPQAQEMPMKPPAVSVSVPVVRRLADYEEFTGRTESKFSVQIKSRVTGYLVAFNFKEGDDVKKGDLLFEIDRRPYQIQLEQARSEVEQAEADLRLHEGKLQRARRLLAARSIGKEEFDTIFADRDKAEATLHRGQAAVKSAQLNLEYCRITAPFDGRTGRNLMDPGNLVKADETVLSTLGSVNPMYANFDVDERTVLRVLRLFREGKIKGEDDPTITAPLSFSRRGGKGKPGKGRPEPQPKPPGQLKLTKMRLPIEMKLADEEGYPHRGYIYIIDNRIEPTTGTLRLWGEFDNADEVLAAGLFVRVRVPIGEARDRVLVAERAIGSDQARKFVYVLNDKDEAVYRPVTLGPPYEGLIAVENVRPGERVVVSGLQRVRPGVKVEPKMEAMLARGGGVPPPIQKGEK